VSESVSVFDLIENKDTCGQRALRDELAAQDLDFRKRMDAGLAPEEMSGVKAARDAIQAASSILNKIF
jgi:hypothetical protein